jgi:hypothetical protein
MMKFAISPRHPFALLGALALLCATPVASHAEERHGSHGAAPDAQTQKSRNALVRVVREATEKFKDPAVADAEGYKLMFGCVSGPDFGAMGLHLVKGELLFDGELNPETPEIVIYEPLPNGKMRLIGADFLVDAAQWHAKHGKVQPQIMGQLLHLFEAPNRFGLDPFYTLHVWAWKDSPTGTFVNWHANVSCDAFSDQQD